MLTVLVKDIGVALNWIQPRTLVDLGQEAIERDVDTSSLDELIEVSRDNDFRLLIQRENRIDEILEQDELLLTKIVHKQMNTPQ